jgi:hypothetical protein
MKLCLALFFVAALFNGAGWWVHIIGEADMTPLMELIQLGGTGGLILCLFSAIIVLWRERVEVRAQWRGEVDKLHDLLVAERTEHRSEVANLRKSHQADLENLGQKYTDELRKQIDVLREEAHSQIEAERRISDERYGNP